MTDSACTTSWNNIPNGWKVARLARELKRSRDFVYKWADRIFDPANETFREKYMSRSCAPKSSEKWVSEEVEKVIVELREELSEKYGRTAGGKPIIRALHQRDDLKDEGHYLPTSPTTVSDILRQYGYILPSRQKLRQLIALPPPMDEWEIDFGLTQLGDKTWFEFFVVIDRGTSRIIYLEGDERYNAETSLEAFAKLFILHGLPKRVRIDRDTRLVASWTSDSYPSALLRFLRVLGVDVVICPPRQPWKKPFVERVIYTIKHEWFRRQPMGDLAEARDALESFPHYYHHERPHYGQACRGRTPDEAFPTLPTLPHVPETVNPNAWLDHDHGRAFRRRVNSRGFIQVDKHRYYVGQRYAKRPVLVHLDARQRKLWVNDGSRILAEFPIGNVAPTEEMPFDAYVRQMKQEARSIELHRFWLWHRRGEEAA